MMYILKKSITLHYAVMMMKDRITSYTYGASAGKVCKKELLSKVNIK